MNQIMAVVDLIFMLQVKEIKKMLSFLRVRTNYYPRKTAHGLIRMFKL